MTVSATPASRGLESKGPNRRRAIVRAATRVLRAAGIEGLTHRAVAEEAGLALGSTTYYFSSRDDLLNAAIEHATDTNIAWLQAWGTDNATSELADVLPQMFFDYVTQHRAVAILDVEVYVLAARRPELRVHSSRWTAAFVDIVSTFVDRDTATHVAATFNGLLLIEVSGDRPASLPDYQRIFARALTRP